MRSHLPGPRQLMMSRVPLLPDSSSTFNHFWWDYCNRILLYKLRPCVLLPQSLATHYSLSKRAIAGGEIDTERSESVDLCVLHICLASPPGPILRVKSSDPKLSTDLWWWQSQQTSINQSDFLSPAFIRGASPHPFCCSLSTDPVVIPVLKLIKTWLLWSNVFFSSSSSSSSSSPQSHERIRHKDGCKPAGKSHQRFNSERRIQMVGFNTRHNQWSSVFFLIDTTWFLILHSLLQ